MADDQTPSAAYARLLSLAVHELRTPASVVGGYLRMLERDSDPELTGRQRKMVEEAAKSCARIVALVAELSEISKLDAGTAALAEDRFDLFELVREVASDVHEPDDRDVRLEARSNGGTALVAADKTRIRAALTACFRAVLREQPAACTVVADCRRGHPAAPASAVVVVAPDGDVQNAYAADAAPFDEKRGGLGLALPIARRVLERSGGRIWSPRTSGDGGPRTAIIIALPSTESGAKR